MSQWIFDPITGGIIQQKKGLGGNQVWFNEKKYYPRTEVDIILEEYVPYIGADKDVDLGDNDLSSKGIFSKTLKSGNIEGNNYTEIEADGTIRLHGDATAFRDEMNQLILQLKNNPSDKLINNVSEGSVTYKNNTGLNDYSTMSIQLNHDRKNGAPIYPHLHYWQSSINTPNWLLQYRYQRNGQSKETSWAYLVPTENAYAYTSGTLNQIVRFRSITPPTGDNVSDILQIRLIRDVSDASGEFDGAETSPIDQDAVSLDVHIEVDTIGSREEYIK